jgi:ankyrin repeat protein
MNRSPSENIFTSSPTSLCGKKTTALIIALCFVVLAAAPALSAEAKTIVLFHNFIMHGKLAHMTQLLDRYPDLINAKLPDGGYSPLHSAAMRNRPEIAALLIEKGSDVNALDNKGHTPLYYARTCENQEMVTLLNAHGAHE